MDLTPVLKLMNDTSHNPATAVNGHRGLKIKPAMRTISASKRTAYRTGKRLRTGRAKWGGNTWRFAVAINAEVLAPFYAGRTIGAHGRIKKRAQRPEQFKF